jgi:integrase
VLSRDADPRRLGIRPKSDPTDDLIVDRKDTPRLAQHFGSEVRQGDAHARGALLQEVGADQRSEPAHTTVRAIVAGAYELDSQFGLFIDVLASVGCRTSQAARLLVSDLQDGSAPRLMLPSSKKGGKGRTSVRRPVPITITLARKLEQAATGRSKDAPLLKRPDGSAWNSNSMELVRLFAQVAERLKIAQTAYCLRHSSIVRALLAGTPTRVVAALHDTSTRQLESVYSFFISDHADAVARRGLIDTSAPAPDESAIPIAGRR